MADLEQRGAELQRDYAVTFGCPAGQRVLADLEIFCCAVDTTAVPGNSDKTFMNEGRREVVLRIMKFAKFTPDDIYNMRKGLMSLRSTDGEAIR